MGNLGEPAISGDIVQLFVDAAFSKPVATATVTAGATSWSSSTFQTNRPEFQIWAMTVHPPSVDPSYQKGTASEPVLIDVRTKGPKPQDAEPVDLSMTGGKIRVRFDEAIDSASLTKNSFELRTSDTPPTKVQAASASVDGNDPTLVNVDFSNVAPNQYLLYILPPIKDQFGNLMAGTVDQPAYKFPIVQPVGGNAPTLAPGITATAGPFIKFPEYTPPRPEQNGFNPSDKVVTRTARLYYFRDAHRVAQIVNRKARSYNRAAVDVAQQLADRSRGIADQETDARQALERGAVNAATETRAVQHQLDAAQSALGAAQQGQANSQANLSAAQQQTLNAQANGSLQPGDQTLTSAQLRQEVATLQPSAATGSSTTSTGSTTTSTGAPTLTTAQQSQATAETGLANALDAQTAAQTATQSAATQLANAQSTVQDLLQTLQIKRSAEIQANERALQADAAEERAREDQFRREVAAGHADPDTYAPGVPGSVDPVEQVSISVIGEGVIQLRGPIKGVNMVRTMINDIDAPVGQVRVSIDTCQVNGEHGERMEVVVGMIQRYIDHARFLTTQSAEMLRKSVVKVASDKAFMAARECPERSQQFRDEKYLDAFFGQDFIDELRTLDSEFLKTGNKLLSLHSMDTTSLSAALFLFALAKNTTRREILEEFLRQVETELPGDEAEFLQAAGRREPHERRMQLLGENARFVSLRGFFNGEVTGPDTLNPIQRQFIRLAQIFKSRLVTELELNQRVMERSMIEERLGDYIAELRKAKDKDDKAQQALTSFQNTLRENQVSLLNLLSPVVGQEEAVRGSFENLKAQLSPSGPVGKWINQVATWFALQLEGQQARVAKDAPLENYNRVELAKLGDIVTNFRNRFFATDGSALNFPTIADLFNTRRQYLAQFRKVYPNATPEELKEEELSERKTELRLTLSFGIQRMQMLVHEDGTTTFERPNDWPIVQNSLQKEKILVIGILSNLKDKLKTSLNYTDDQINAELAEPQRLLNQVDPTSSLRAYSSLHDLCVAVIMLKDITNGIYSPIADASTKLSRVATLLESSNADVKSAYRHWTEVRPALLTLSVSLNSGSSLTDVVSGIEKQFGSLLSSDLQVGLARQIALDSRQPLDHKKFLDMLTDDVEDKYIELLEGTRAHTANIDAYIKRLATALDDDFNTQFYEPAFRLVRKASRFRDVELGQIETTSILANNRAFAQVSPQATMEFDLPKRDIVINEAFKAAQAAYSDYGALLTDPTFLGLTKMYSGQPTSSVFNSAAPAPLVQNVLPGLPSSSDESLLTQQRPNTPQLGSALEGLIPDPAVYKFETGTGYSIRPVIQPDGQSVVFHLNYMYTTNVREPVRADEKHLGRIKRHFVDTDVQLGNYELREVSRYRVALKASRTSRGVPLLEDVPGLNFFFTPLPQAESSLQENVILAQSTIFPTLFDLMGLRWAPAVADLDALRLQESEFVTRQRQRALRNRVFDYSSVTVATSASCVG